MKMGAEHTLLFASDLIHIVRYHIGPMGRICDYVSELADDIHTSSYKVEMMSELIMW